MKLKILIAATGLTLATPVFAITAFASFIPDNSVPNIEFTGTGAGAGTLTSTAAPVTFRFLDSLGLGNTSFSALLNLAITTTDGSVVAGGTLGVLPVSSGTISFTSLGPVMFNGQTGTNLLTATFSGGFVTGQIGGSTANYGNSEPPRTVTFTSDFLDFSSSTARDLALAIAAINPLLDADSVFGGVANFSGTVAGNFGVDGSVGIPGAIPEPGTWLLMVAGFGLIGSAMRRRSSVPVVTA